VHGSGVLAFALVCSATAARAAPAADLVVVWAPNVPQARIAAVAAVARDAGAALIDRSPDGSAGAPGDADQLVATAVAAYDALRLEDARTDLDRALAAIDATDAATITPAHLSDLFVYRGLVHAQQGDDASAWDDLVVAATLDPARVLDPARFPPRVIAEWDRARTAVAALAHATVTVDAPPSCAIALDASPAARSTSVVTGSHYVRVTCDDAAPWTARVAVTAPETTVVAHPAPYAPPDDADLAIQARTAGARAIVVAEVHALVGVVRLVDAGGRERDRRTVTLAGDGSLAPLAAAVAALLAPPPPRPTVVATPAPQPWYRSKWAYAAAAAVLAAAVLVPTTALIVGSGPATTATVHVSVPPW
jgi:hypothetical protein